MELTPDLLVAFLTLFVLELILGVDNVVFISILVNRLPQQLQQRARIIGLSLAMILRIVLLFFATWIVGLTEPLFGWGETETWQFSGRDLILLVGGLFLIYKATTEIHHKLEGEEEQKKAGGTGTTTFGRVLLQIIAIDAVFSLDSVITAVGMTDEIVVMIAAVVLSIGLMMVIARQIGDFVNRHPTVKMLALSFLVLIGASLVAEGFGVHIDKPLIYGPIGFAIAVETLNLVYRNRQAKRRGATREPVRLHGDKRVGVRAGDDATP